MPTLSPNTQISYTTVQKNLFEKDEPVKTSKQRNKLNKIIAVGWYGGKFSHLDWLLPLLPKSTHFCKPFGGSAAVLLNRDPSPVETYNDLDGEVGNFFAVLRDQKDTY